MVPFMENHTKPVLRFVKPKPEKEKSLHEQSISQLEKVMSSELWKLPPGRDQRIDRKQEEKPLSLNPPQDSAGA
jgi:hypothetical protein